MEIVTTTPHQVPASVARAIEQSHSQNTRYCYARAWMRWCAYRESTGHDALDPDPLAVAQYLVHRADGGAGVSALRMDRSAIRFHFTESGMHDPSANPGVIRTLKGLTRRIGDHRKQADGITANVFSAICATACRPRPFRGGMESTATATRRGQRDIALIATMRDCLLRRSETSALTWGDVQFLDDGTGRLLIRRSKSDQAGAGSVQYLARQTVDALKKIQPDHAPDPETSIFGLSPASICRRIAAACAAAGVKGKYTGHSPRVGMARDLSASGTALPALMTAGRWSSPSMPAMYTRNEVASRSAVAQYYAGS